MRKLTEKEANEILEDLFSSSTNFKDYEESFYNKDDYQEEYKAMNERDLRGGLIKVPFEKIVINICEKCCIIYNK